jgi:hypothetical protein
LPHELSSCRHRRCLAVRSAFFVGQHLNDIRLVLNNIALGAKPSERRPPPRRLLYMTAGSLPLMTSYLELTLLAAMLLLGRCFNLDPTKAYSLANIDPALLNETGRNHLQRASRHQLIMLAWTIAGLILIVWIASSGTS